MGIITSNLSKVGDKLKGEWDKGWSERSAIGNVTLAVPKLGVEVASGLFGTPFSNTRSKINQEVDRDGKVQVKNFKAPLYFKGKGCKVPLKHNLENTQVKKSKSGGYDFIYGGKAHRLSPVTDEHDNIITKNNGDKLFYINSFKENEQYTSMVWVNRDGALVHADAGKIIHKKISNEIKAITIVPRDEKTGTIHVLFPIVWPAGLVATLVKQIGATLKTLIDIPGNALCKAQDKLLSGLDLKHIANKNFSIEYISPPGLLSKVSDGLRYGIASVCGVTGNVLTSIGTVTNEILRLSSAIISTPSALCGSTYREVKKEHLITVGKSLFSNIKGSTVELANSVTKRPENVDGEFKIATNDEVSKKAENTVQYGHKAELQKGNKSMKNEVLAIGKSLLNLGVKESSTSQSFMGYIMDYAKQHDVARAV